MNSQNFVKKQQNKKSNKKLDTYSHKGWLQSDYFWKRALAVIGYNTVGRLMIYGVILAVVLIGMLIALLISLAFRF